MSHPNHNGNQEVWWMNCSQCEYEIAATGSVKCPYCECHLTRIALAGAITDMRNTGPERVPPSKGGCWICETDPADLEDDMAFDMEFDAFFHESCLPDDCNSLLDYEKSREVEDEIQ